MQINKSGYGHMDWVLALKAKTSPKSDFSPESSSDEETPEVIDGALEQTCKAAFKTPTTEKSDSEAIAEESKSVADLSRKNSLMAQAEQIRGKLSARGIDPVAMGVANNQEWASGDPSLVEAIAKQAVLVASQSRDRSWETISGTKKATGFDEASKMGQVIPSGTRREDVVDHRRNIPSNSPSMFDPNRLKELSEKPNEHDQSIASIKDGRKARAAEKKADSENRSNIPEDFSPMKAGRSMAISGNEQDAMVHRVPRNQLSMLDNLEPHTKLTQEEMKNKLQDIFMNRVADPREETRKANEERKAEISREKREKHEFKLEPPSSTSEMTKKLMSLWPDEKGE
jgi:hypothetical protein